MIYLSIMKYIINESQSELLNLLRKWGSEEHEELMADIVHEGLSYYDICEFPTIESYSNAIIDNSARTFLYHWLEPKDEKINSLLEVIKTKMEQDFYFFIYHSYYDNIGDC